MNKYVSRGLFFVLFAGGLSLIGIGAANAAETSGEDGLLSGTQVDLGAAVPITVAGNAVSVLGDSASTGSTVETAPTAPAPASPAATSGLDSLLGGLQGIIGITVPVTVSGNAISVVGDSSTAGSAVESAAPATAPTATTPPAGARSESAPATGATTSGTDSILGGTQLIPNITIPITVSGNGISLLGESSSAGSAATVPAAPTGAPSTSGASTSGTDSILGGTQLLGTISIPITVSGNALSLLGDSSSHSAATVAGGTNPAASGSGAVTGGADSILGGTQILPSIGAPITVAGNAISVVGDSESQHATITVPTAPSGSGSATTGGLGSILGGTQLLPSLSLPVTLSGNAISVIGGSTTTESTVTPGGPTTPVTPTDPTDPGTPTTPTMPVTPGTPGTPTGQVTPAGVWTAADGLATTGANALPLLGLVSLLLMAGLALLASRSRLFAIG